MKVRKYFSTGHKWSTGHLPQHLGVVQHLPDLRVALHYLEGVHPLNTNMCLHFADWIIIPNLSYFLDK